MFFWYKYIYNYIKYYSYVIKYILLENRNKSIMYKQKRKNIAQLTGIHTIHINVVKVFLF